MYVLTQLANARHARIMSQENLAELSGVSRITIANLERLHRGARGETVRKLAKALQLTPEQLMHDAGH